MVLVVNTDFKMSCTVASLDVVYFAVSLFHLQHVEFKYLLHRNRQDSLIGMLNTIRAAHDFTYGTLDMHYEN